MTGKTLTLNTDKSTTSQSIENLLPPLMSSFL